MATKVLVPLLGEGVEEVTVIKWLKQEGDPVAELEPLLEVNTDKVDTEIPAPAAGTVLRIVMQEGSPARVGEVLAFIGKPGEALDDAGAPRQETQAPAVKTASTPQQMPEAVEKASAPPANREIGFISPVVAKIAAEHGVNLSRCPAPASTGASPRTMCWGSFKPNRKPRATASAPAMLAPAEGDSLIKHTVIRKQIAEHMLHSKQTAPHVLTVMEADMSRVARHRAAHKESFSRDGANLTFTAYFMMAIVAGLKAYPNVNSSWTDEGVLLHRAINIGMATSLGEEGLIVPVIRNADNLSLLAMARAVNDLAYRARAKKLQPEEVRGGTFTLTNHGVSGSLFAYPIINQPQTGILGIGALQKRAVVIDDAIAIRPMVYLSFVFDHRILDGASADWFLAKVKETLENWS